MTVVDILAVVALGVGFARGRKRGVGFELYKFARLGLPLLVGCGLFGLMRGVLSHLPFLSLDGAGVAGFALGGGAAFVIIHKLRSALRTRLEKRFEGGPRTVAAVLGMIRSGVLVSVIVGAIGMTPVRRFTDASVIGRAVSKMTGAEAEAEEEGEVISGQ